MRRRNLRSEELSNPGDLKQRVEILKLDADDNKVGGLRNEEWVVVSKVWAHIHNLSGSERFENSQLQAELTHRITIRYRKDITREYRIRYQGRIFEIDYMVNVDEVNRFLGIYVTERI